MADFNNTNLADFSGVWVFCEQRQGKLQPTVLELISEARKLADDMGVGGMRPAAGGKGVATPWPRSLALMARTRFWLLRTTCSRPTPPMLTQR